MRTFLGGYQPDYTRLMALGYTIGKLSRPIISPMNNNQGLGQINGITTEDDNNGAKLFPYAQVCVFKRSTRELVWETKSDSNGSYRVRNIAAGLECFVVAFDPSREYNAVIQDAVVAK